MAEKWTGQTGQSRVFMQDYGPGPEREPELLLCANVDGLDWTQGDLTPIFCQHPDRYDAFQQVDEVRGAPELPGGGMNMLMGKTNPLLAAQCPFNLYLHFGKCRDPNSFNFGWEKGFIYESAGITAKSSEQLVTHDGEGAPIAFAAEFSARDFYQLDPITFGPEAVVEMAGAEGVGIVVCDWLDCGDCGEPSTGCRRVYALTNTNVASAIANPQIVATTDGGAIWAAYAIPTLAGNPGPPPSPLACVGDILVVAGETDNLITYAYFTDLTTWTGVTGGLVAGNPPSAIFSLNARETWVVGQNGYIWYTTDPRAGLTIQSPGDVTAQNLVDVHFLDSENGMAVGAAGVVVFTRNGGRTWQLATTNWLDNNLCCEMATAYTWWVGDDNGILHYTTDGGATWGAFNLAAQLGVNCEVQDVQFGTPSVGYVLVNQFGVPDAGVYPEILGKILRTTNGGFDWYEIPEPITAGTLPVVSAFNSVATCGANELWTTGLEDDFMNGMIVHGLGY